MATRVYTTSQAVDATPLTPSSWSAGWNNTGTTVIGAALPSPFATLNLPGNLISVSRAGTGVSGQFVAFGRWIYKAPLMAQTISGTVKGQFKCNETGTGDNYTLAVGIKVVQSDGTDRGVLLAVAASDDTSATPPEMATTLTNRRLQDSSENTSISLSSLAVSAGDYLVIEVGFRQSSTSVSNGTLQYGPTTTGGDLPEDTTSTSAANGWVEFSQDIAFQPVYFGSVATPEDAVAATGTADPTAVTPPTGCLAGDLVFMIGDSRIAGLTQAVSEASGQTWTSHAQQSATTKSVRVFTCTFNGTWGANPSVSFGSTTCNSVYMHVFRPPTTSYTWSVNVAQTSTNDTTSPFSALTGHTTTGTDPTVTLQGWHSPDDNTWGTLTGTGWEVIGSAQYRNTSGSDQSASFARAISTTAQTLATPGKSQLTLGADNTQMWAITMAATAPLERNGLIRFVNQSSNRASRY